jgi:hypothetical protein
VSDPPATDPSHVATTPNSASGRSVDAGVDSSRLARLASKARIVAKLSSGDVRVIAEEVARELEALAGPVADVVPLGTKRS